MTTNTITMDLNDLGKEAATQGSILALALGGVALGLQKLLTLFRRERADSANADAERAKSEADMATYKRAVELLEFERVTSAQLVTKVQKALEQMEALREDNANLRADNAKLLEKVDGMRRAHSLEIATLQRYIVRLGGSIKDFQDSRPSGATEFN